MKGLRKGVSLVARRSVSGPVFERSVIVLIDYAEDRGATGLVLNKPTPLRVAELVGPMGALKGRDDVVWIAGPVQPEVAWILHIRDDVDTSGSLVRDGLLLGGDVTLLANLARSVKEDPAPGSFRFMRGYSGWAKGQLEAEIDEGSWNLVDLLPETIFGTPADALWDDAMARSELPFPLPPRTLSQFKLN